MWGVAAFLAMVFATEGARAPQPPEGRGGELAVTIQIHDYTDTSTNEWLRAREIVTRMYGRIGVRTEWLGVFRPNERRASGGETAHVPLAQLTLIILTPKMAARGHSADGVLGFAAVAEQGMGRIAYVIPDRVQSIARETGANEVDVLAFVMAHELGHLLLPHAEAKNVGLMKSQWDRRELRQLDMSTLGFSSVQAAQIRDTVAMASGTLAAVATAGELDTPRGKAGDPQADKRSPKIKR